MNITLRKAQKDDSEFLFNLRNEEAVRRVSGNSESISFETHSAWFAKKLAGAASVIFITEEEGIPIAQIRFDIEGKDNADISIAVVASKRGKGYGATIIKAATTRFLEEHRDVSAVSAFINLGNEASRKSFAKAGYKDRGESNKSGLQRHLFVFSRVLE